jgi:hypothetical protein
MWQNHTKLQPLLLTVLCVPTIELKIQHIKYVIVFFFLFYDGKQPAWTFIDLRMMQYGCTVTVISQNKT